jgi:heme/copper-type cytochrome/quinol oxidase subunit 2
MKMLIQSGQIVAAPGYMTGLFVIVILILVYFIFRNRKEKNKPASDWPVQ